MEATDKKPEIPDDVRKALGYIGSIKTAKKSAASAENGKLGGRPQKPLSEIPCTCGAGESLQHGSLCPRGRAIRRRQKAGEL